ncbi:MULTISPECIES: divergent PAP2 family protein [unclassified Psychrobacillus]|uniref:divergent PAP2 family protein n=1 Tax=unclassified Psychrobacillus TaxID=2636677 RepID=UPI00146CCC4E|nr:divergent PAP2 family protein [uncultured Psychrobacillus sp.]MCM3359596.1 divergent PAP2 family protein [Psychrobacillus sp. MER TA 171]NME05931.1 divergent PAP2 family protein [Psychrobacillus sp. BL-248-WT-3]
MAILQNTPLLAALFSIFFAQFVKIPIHFLVTKKIDWKLFTSTGGMPSSHSAAVTSLCTAIAFETGLDSTLFAVATVFAVIVMFDATGVRFQAGQQAIIINQMRVDFQTFVNQTKDWGHKKSEEKLEELKTLLGHKPIEVFMGALTGILISIVIYTVIL